MSALRAEDIYRQHIKSLPLKERMRIVEMIGHDVAENAEELAKQAKRSIMELHGLGKEIWAGIDAQDYVNELRNEWDRQP